MLLTKTDKELMKAYWWGWDNIKILPDSKGKELQLASEIGMCDFIAGDDLSSVDLQSKSEILTHIKKYILNN